MLSNFLTAAWGQFLIFGGTLLPSAAFEDEEESQYFDAEDVFQQLNYECNDFGGDSGSDRDEDVVCDFQPVEGA